MYMKSLLLTGMLLILQACGNSAPISGSGAVATVVQTPSLDCTVKQDATGTTISCPDGSTAVIPVPSPGPQGSVGATGQPGASCTTKQVPDGIEITCPDGSSTTVKNSPQVTPVQLCSSYTTTYPTTFPEFGFCIGGSLYAVYWTGSQAFEALIPPGVYASTSPQGCNFTVAANCQVTQN